MLALPTLQQRVYERNCLNYAYNRIRLLLWNVLVEYVGLPVASPSGGFPPAGNAVKGRPFWALSRVERSESGHFCLALCGRFFGDSRSAARSARRAAARPGAGDTLSILQSDGIV